MSDGKKSDKKYITFKLDEFEKWLVEISPGYGDNGLVSLMTDEFRENTGGDCEGIENGQLFFAYYGTFNPYELKGKIKEDK